MDLSKTELHSNEPKLSKSLKMIASCIDQHQRDHILKKLSQGLNLDLPKTFSNISDSQLHSIAEVKDKMPRKAARLTNASIGREEGGSTYMQGTPELSKKKSPYPATAIKMHNKATPIKVAKKAEIVQLDSSNKKEEIFQMVVGKSPPPSGGKHVRLIQSFKQSLNQLAILSKE